MFTIMLLSATPVGIRYTDCFIGQMFGPGFVSFDECSNAPASFKCTLSTNTSSACTITSCGGGHSHRGCNCSNCTTMRDVTPYACACTTDCECSAPSSRAATPLLMMAPTERKDAPRQLSPASGATLYTPHPHFSWEPSCSPVAINATCSYRIELRNSTSGRLVAQSTTSSVITRYVPLVPLTTTSTTAFEFEWRVAAVFTSTAGDVWSGWRPFHTHATSASRTYIVDRAEASSFTALQAIFDMACAGDTPAFVRFEPRGMTLTLEVPTNTTLFFATFTECTAPSIVLDFNGASLTFRNVRIGFFSITDCHDIVVQNLDLDLDPLPYSAMRIDAVVHGGSSFIASLMPGHPPVENLGITTRNTFELRDPLTTRTGRGLMESLTYSTAWQRLPCPTPHNSSVCPIRYNISMIKSGLKKLDDRDVGMVAVFGERTGECGFSVSGGARVTFSNVTAFACANECFVSTHTTQLSILGGGLVLQSGRFLASNDGGHNHHTARIGAWVEGGRWENTGDDVCHFSSLVISAETRIDDQNGATTLRLRCSSGDKYCAHNQGGANSQIAIGDVIQFFNRSTTSGEMIGERVVVEVTTVPASEAARKHGAKLQTLVTFAAPPLPRLDLGVITNSDKNSINTVTNVFDLNTTASQFVFRGNKVMSGRRFGVLGKGQRLSIINNSFIGLGSGAVNYLNSVTEGLCARHAIFRDNLVLDAVQLAEHGDMPDFTPSGALWANVAPSVVGTTRSLGGAGKCHRDLLFANNIIDSGPHPVIKLYDVDSAQFVGNEVTRCGDAAIGNPEYGGGFDTVIEHFSVDVDVLENMVLNSTAARLCTKRPLLVKTATDDQLYWLDFDFDAHILLASSVLRKFRTCSQCGVDLCKSMGVTIVDDDFIRSRTVAETGFSCARYPGGRMVRGAIGGGERAVFFQRKIGIEAVYRVEAEGSGCSAKCPGAVCLNVVNVTDDYAATLFEVANEPFVCEMATNPYFNP